MALLSEAKRIQVRQQFAAANAEVVTITKADLKAAVDALDNYLETNAVAINNAIPQPARGALSVAQKAALLMFVTAKRFL